MAPKTFGFTLPDARRILDQSRERTLSQPYRALATYPQPIPRSGSPDGFPARWRGRRAYGAASGVFPPYSPVVGAWGTTIKDENGASYSSFGWQVDPTVNPQEPTPIDAGRFMVTEFGTAQTGGYPGSSTDHNVISASDKEHHRLYVTDGAAVTDFNTRAYTATEKPRFCRLFSGQSDAWYKAELGSGDNDNTLSWGPLSFNGTTTEFDEKSFDLYPGGCGFKLVTGPLRYFDEFFGTYRWGAYVMRADLPIWVVAYENWAQSGTLLSANPAQAWVNCYLLDYVEAGDHEPYNANPTVTSNQYDGHDSAHPTARVQVRLPRSPTVDPNVEAGDVFPVVVHPNGHFIPLGTWWMDAKVGSTRAPLRNYTSQPARGWGDINGTANSGGNGGSGISMATGGSFAGRVLMYEDGGTISTDTATVGTGSSTLNFTTTTMEERLDNSEASPSPSTLL